MRTVALLAGAALVALFLSMAATADFLKRNRDSRLGRCVDEAVAACGASVRDATLAEAPAGSTFRPTPNFELDPATPLPEDLRDLMVKPNLTASTTPAAQSPAEVNQEGSLLFGVGLQSDAGTTADLVERAHVTTPQNKPLNDSDDESCCECGLLGKYLTAWMKTCAFTTSTKLTSTTIQDDAVTPAAFNAYHRNESPYTSKSDKCCAGNCDCCCMKKCGQTTKSAEPCCTPACCSDKAKECEARVSAEMKAVVLEFRSDKNGTYLVGVGKTDDVCCAKETMVVRSYPMAKLSKDDAEQLSCLICRMVAPETWQEVGGAGCVGYFAPGKVLVVRQTSKVHTEVQDFLSQLGEAMQLQASNEKESAQRCRHDSACEECCAGKCCEHSTLAPCVRGVGCEGVCCRSGSTIQLRFDSTCRLVELQCNGCNVECTNPAGCNPLLPCKGEPGGTVKPANVPDELMDEDNFGTIEDAYRPLDERKSGDDATGTVPETTTPDNVPDPDHARYDPNLPGHEPVCPYSSDCQRFSPYYRAVPRAFRPADAVTFTTDSADVLSGKPELTAVVLQLLFPWWPGQEGMVRTAADTGADEDVNDDPSR
jgi:hypothetical protein